MLNLAHNQFLNEVVMPWDQLSIKLARPISVDPQTSTFVADAGAVLTALRHAPERFRWPQERGALHAAVVAEFAKHELITDAADSWKHGTLKNPRRQTTFSVKSQFLLDAGGRVRFLRNIIHLQHATLGEFDCLSVCRSAIHFWLRRQNVELSWTGVIFEGADVFRNEALLACSPGIQVLQHAARISFVVLDIQGNLVPASPGSQTFAVVDDPTLLQQEPIPSSL